MKTLDHQFTLQEKNFLNSIFAKYIDEMNHDRDVNTSHATRNFCFDSIPLPTSEGFDFVHIHEISYLQAENNYTWVILKSEVRHLVCRNLKDLSAFLPLPQFFRVHKSYLVNLNYVVKYIRGQGGFLVMPNMAQTPVSRSTKEELMRTLNI